jgi:hypothetical protein
MTRDRQESFDDAAEDRRRWEAERRAEQQREADACQHPNPMVATRPWCPDCRQLIPVGHPSYKAVKEALRRMAGGGK